LYETSAGTGNVRFYTNNIGQEQARVSHTASAVNYHQLTGSATGSGPIHSVAGSDTNIDLNLTTKGTGGVRFNVGNGVKYTYLSSDAANNTQLIGAVGGNLGIYATSAGSIRFYTTTGLVEEQLRISQTVSAVNYVQVTGAATTGAPVISSQGSDTNIPLSFLAKGASSLGFANSATAGAFGIELAENTTVDKTTFIDFHSSASTDFDFRLSRNPSVNGNAVYQNQGTGSHVFYTASSANQFTVAHTASAVNYFQAKGGATGFGPVLSAQGSDTNIHAVVQPKGTGALQAQQTDSTATGGNARGANAVDWQTVRSAASQVASGSTSFIGAGRRNTSSGEDSFVGAGFQNTSSVAQASVINGAANAASSQYAFIGNGNNNTANHSYSSVVNGANNTASGYYGFIGSGASNTTTSSSPVTTQSATMNGTTAVTLSGSNANIKVGQVVTGTFLGFPVYVTAVSGTSLTISVVATGSGTSTLSFYTPHGVVVGGGNNQATGSYSFIGGGGDAGTAANRNVASGDWSAVVGGQRNVASGIGSFIGGGGTSNANTASGSNSVICGGGAFGPQTAGGIGSFVGAGWANNASEAGSVCLGIGGIANGNYSSTLGGAYGNARGIAGYTVFSASNAPMGTVFTNQGAILILARQTTDATPTILRSDTGAASTTNQVILPNNSAYAFKGTVIANVTGAANGASWSFEGAIMRGANAASTVLMGTPAINRVAATAGATAWAIAITADTTNGGLAVTVTGAASTTIRFVAQISTTEVTF
jgi:hypothetical protein